MDLADNLRDDKSLTKTKDGLPRVTQEAIDSFKRKMKLFISTNSRESEIEEWTKEIESENPALLCLFQEFVAPYPSYLQGLTVDHFVSIYHLLKVQAVEDSLSAFKKIYEFFEQAGYNRAEEDKQIPPSQNL